MAGVRLAVVIWVLVVFGVTCHTQHCVGSTVSDNSGEEVFVEEEEETMSLSATRPLTGLSQKARQETAKARFLSLDSNGDGKLDRSELKSAHASINTDEALRRLLLILDNDGNGHVSEDEMVAAATLDTVPEPVKTWPSLEVVAAVSTALAVAAGGYAYLRRTAAPARHTGDDADVRSARLQRLGVAAAAQPDSRRDDSDSSPPGAAAAVAAAAAAAAAGPSHDDGNAKTAERKTKKKNNNSRHVPGMLQAFDNPTGSGSTAGYSSGGAGGSASGDGQGSGCGDAGAGCGASAAGPSGAGHGVGAGGDDDDGNDRNRGDGGQAMPSADADADEEEEEGESEAEDGATEGEKASGDEVNAAAAGAKEGDGEGSQGDGEEPAAKRMKCPPVDVRAKRLARFQNQLSDSGAQSSPPTTPTSKLAENPLTALAKASAASASSPSSVTKATPTSDSPVNTARSQPVAAVKSVKKAPAADPAPVLSTEDAVGRLLSTVLDVNLTVTGGGSYSCAGATRSLTIAATLLPTKAEKNDPGRFCLSCYNRAEDMARSLDAAAAGGAVAEVPVLALQRELLKLVEDVSAAMFLERLVEAGDSQSSGDLWATYSSRGDAQSPFCQMLSRFSGYVSDGISVSPSCLVKVMEITATSQHITSTFMRLIRVAGDEVMAVKRLDEMPLRFNLYNDALQVLLGQPCMHTAVAEALANELKDGQNGCYFQKRGALAGLLNITTIQSPIGRSSKDQEKFQCYKELPGFPQPHDDACRMLHSQIQAATQGAQGLVHGALFKIIKRQESRETVLSWLAGVLCMNQLRTAAQFKGQELDPLNASDGFMVNVCAVMLRLCQPIFTSVVTDRLKKIDPAYTSQLWCRLDLHDEPCLARGRIESNHRQRAGFERFCMPAEYQGKANFLTECFHLTQLALYVGVMPTIRRFSKMLSDLQRSQHGKEGDELKSIQAYSTIFFLSWGTSLLDPLLVRQCCEFYVTQAVWINMLLASAAEEGGSEEEIHERQRKTCSTILEFSVKSMTSWFYLISQFQPSSLQGMSLTALVDCCVNLLERPDLLPSPLSQTRIVELLLAFLESSGRSRSMRWGGHGHGQLASIVHGSPTAQEQLGPALLHTYAAVDVVEGLDVDKEDFDKFGARAHIQRLLQLLWERHDCRSSVIALAGTPRFQRFLNANLDTLLYQMNDSLRRVTNVRQLQLAKDDVKTWKALSSKERSEKEAFLRSEESVGSSFMKMAVNTLHLLEMVLEEESVAALFREAPLSIRAAAAVVEFTDALCGGQRTDLNVKNPEKMNFNPRKLVLTITSVAVRMAGLLAADGSSATAATAPGDSSLSSESDSSEGGASSGGDAGGLCNGFITALSEHPDYMEETMSRASLILRSCPGATEAVICAFGVLQAKVREVSGGSSPSDGIALADLTVESDDAMTDGGDMAAADTSNTAWQDIAEAADLCLDGIADIYVEALREAVVDTTEDLAEDHSMESQFADQPLDPRSPKVHALMKEVMTLPTNLPVHPCSSIFLRQDEDRLDVMRALITGPIDTPYSLGCFAFDIYCPASYPTNPPLVKLVTTGNGTVRFNPNLYADGKVCLSLLGTWHGGSASEKWDPKTSSIYQVLVSIQGMILIPDPMYNEPGYEGMRGTAEGNARSAKYNSSIRLSTVRHALLGMLRKPPAGFEDIVAVHFTIQKDVILRQMSRWLRDCQTPQEEQKLRRAVDELRAVLEKM